ncbi:unnamed protein product [Brachionus calyciflorus]|uniref:J domain-containing protein n=1 Tax=Brachionus calyciflorus TaxID=104777 RepID=A0A814HIC4_9BILA|nr:unnamed protein product [Brachionus calyciflorus]
MESLIKQFDTEHGLAMSKKIPGYLLENKDKDILNSEVKEIEFIGLNEIYYLRTVYDVEPKIIERAQIQIGSGLAVLAIGLVFPPALVVCGPVAGALISEGVCDIVMELISQGDSEFNEKEYAKSKIISYGISVATMGISAVASCLKLLSKASKVCASISNAFRNSPFMKSIMKKVGDKIMDLSKKIDTLIKTRLADIEKISKLSKVDKIKLAFRNVAVETLTSVGTSVLDQQITEPALKEILKSLKPQIKQKVKEKLENCQEIIDKMKSYKKNEKEKELDKDISKALDSDITEDILDISREISIGVLSSAKQKWVRNIALILDSVVSIHKMNTFADNFCIKLNQHLKTIDSNSQKKADSNSEDLSEVVDNLSDQVTERIFSLAINLGKQFTGRITNPLISNVVEHIVPSVKFNGNSNDSIIQKNDDDSSKVNQNTEFQNALKTLGLGPNPTLAEITRAYRLKSLLNHPDRGGSTEAMQRINNARVILMNNSTKPHSNSTANNSTENNSTRNNSNSSGNPIPKNSLIVMGNTEINNCGQYVISKIFNVDPHDLWRKTGVTNFGQGSHVSDHKLQFRILGFEPVEYNFKSLTRNDVQDFLKTNNSSQAMLFINKQNTESIGHVVLVKNTNNILTVHDTFYKMPLDEFLLKKNGSLTGTLLTGNNLDFQMTHVRNAINQNSMPHQSLFNLHSTGQESNRQRYGSVTGKKKNKKRKRISSTDANQNKKNRKRKIFTENNTHYPGFTLNGAIKEHVHGRVSDFLKVCEIVRLLKINGCDFVVEASAKFQAFQGIHPGKDDSSKDHRIIDSSNFDRMNNDLKNHDTSQTTKNIEQYIKQYQDHLSNLDKTQRAHERISPTFNKELKFEFNGISYRFNNIDFILNNFDKRFSSLNFPFQVGTHLDAAHTTGIHIQAQTKDKFFNFVQQNLLNRLISMTNLLPKCLNIGPDKIIDDAQQKFAEKLIDLIGKNKTLSIQDMKNLMHEYIDTCIDKLTIKKNEVNDNLVKLEVLAKYIDELKRIKNTIDDLIVSKIRLNCKEDISCLMEEFEKK